MTNSNSAKLGKALIVGMGKTGYSCANYLAANNIEFGAADSRVSPPMLEQFRVGHGAVEMWLGDLDTKQLDDIDTLVVSPGVPLNMELIERAIIAKKEIIGDIELFARHAKAPIVAITGSNGKSTVTTLLGEMIVESELRVAVGGNIGIPALDLLNQEMPDYYVLELSSFQLDLIKKLPAVASVVLNISADHMDRYSSMEDYAASKLKIYQHANTCVFNKDDERIVGQLPASNLLAFTAGVAADDEFGLVYDGAEVWLSYGREQLVSASELKVFGLHNYTNVLAAFALGHSIGLPHAAMISAAKKFVGLRHRCELVFERNNIKWFNDSKATNVGAACASILSLGNNIILIAGGVAKDMDFSLLRKAVSEKVKAVVLIGRDAPLLAAALQGCAQIVEVAGMHRAILEAEKLAQPNSCVLLAPACASFDMYENYEARGEDFARKVKEVVS